MYTAKMCHNAVLGDSIHFILGWLHLSRRTTVWVQTADHINADCLATGLKILGFMTTHFSIASISNWCTCSPLGLCYVTHITLADTPTRCTSWNVVIFYDTCKYYIEKKLHTVYPMLYKQTPKNSKK